MPSWHSGRLNNNGKNIRLTWHIDEKCINFLDLDISLEGNKLFTKTHFANVDADSYLSMELSFQTVVI